LPTSLVSVCRELRCAGKGAADRSAQLKRSKEHTLRSISFIPALAIGGAAKVRE
jgi:hypothetical protein